MKSGDTLKAIVRHCEDCQHREWVKASNGLRCLRGHKPRFYRPRNGNPYDEGWGWKRRCADFVMGDHVQVIRLPNQSITTVIEESEG